MGIRRTKHAVYDLKYHLVWIPKYRKHILDKGVSNYLKATFDKIACEVFREFPELRKQLWAGELWNADYFIQSVEGKVAADIIRKYIEYQTHEDDSTQLNMFDNS